MTASCRRRISPQGISEDRAAVWRNEKKMCSASRYGSYLVCVHALLQLRKQTTDDEEYTFLQIITAYRMARLRLFSKAK